MVLIDQYTRQIIEFATHAGNLDGIAVCCMFSNIISTEKLARYLSSDHDPLSTSHRWRANLRILEVEEVKFIPSTQSSHSFVERLIRICRNEILYRSLFWTALDLQRKLDHNNIILMSIVHIWVYMVKYPNKLLKMQNQAL